MDMKPLVYIESSVISYLAAKPGRDIVIAARQAVTHNWWTNKREEFDLCISALVEEEISKGDPEAAKRRLAYVAGINKLTVSALSTEIAEHLITDHAIPIGSEEDAIHIGIAASHGVQYLNTWNYKHINNVHTKLKIEKLIEQQGLFCSIICTPEELGGYFDV